MPTNRRFKSRTALRVGPLEREHFATGPDHLLAVSDDPAGPVRCWVCARGGIESARLAWQAHRAHSRLEFCSSPEKGNSVSGNT